MNEGVEKSASSLERTAWIIILLSMLTQISEEVAFPAYNVALGFWGVYCAFTAHVRALFGFISFMSVSLILDIVFCTSMSQGKGGSAGEFALVVFIICMIVKLPAIWYSSLMFSAVGGASSLENDSDGAKYRQASPVKQGVSQNYEFQ